MKPIYVGEMGLILAVAGNAALHLLLLPQNVPGEILALASAIALLGLLLGVWALIAEDTDPARMWERAARRADRRATSYLDRAMPDHAKREIAAAAVARTRAAQINHLNQKIATPGGRRAQR